MWSSRRPNNDERPTTQPFSLAFSLALSMKTINKTPFSFIFFNLVIDGNEEAKKSICKPTNGNPPFKIIFRRFFFSFNAVEMVATKPKRNLNENHTQKFYSIQLDLYHTTFGRNGTKSNSITSTVVTITHIGPLLLLRCSSSLMRK